MPDDRHPFWDPFDVFDDRMIGWLDRYGHRLPDVTFVSFPFVLMPEGQ